MSIREKSLELLFVSKVRIKALNFFLLNPNMPIHLRGAVREFKEEINAVRRELIRLEDMKLISVENVGNRKYFKLNLEHPFINELLGVFHKTFGLGGDIVDNVKKLGTIEFAFLTPSYTKGIYLNNQVIDVTIIGMVDMNFLETIIKKHQDKGGREIHYTVIKPSEFQIRKRRKEDFIMNLMIQDPIMLVGSHEDMVRL
jgi:DNA-binding transcriptional ArsR family regulator